MCDGGNTLFRTILHEIHLWAFPGAEILNIEREEGHPLEG